MLMKTKKWLLSIISVFCAMVLSIAIGFALPTAPVKAEGTTTNLSDLGGRFADAKTDYVEVTSSPEYSNHVYDFAANGDKLDLSFDLKLISAGQLRFWFYNQDWGNYFSVVLFTGGSGGSSLGGVIQTGGKMGNQIKTVSDLMGKEYTVNFVMEWTNEGKTLTSSLTYANKADTTDVYEVWKDWTATFDTSYADLYNWRIAPTATLGLKDAEMQSAPESSDSEVETPSENDLGDVTFTFDGAKGAQDSQNRYYVYGKSNIDLAASGLSNPKITLSVSKNGEAAVDKQFTIWNASGFTYDNLFLPFEYATLGFSGSAEDNEDVYAVTMKKGTVIQKDNVSATIANEDITWYMKGATVSNEPIKEQVDLGEVSFAFSNAGTADVSARYNVFLSTESDLVGAGLTDPMMTFYVSKNGGEEVAKEFLIRNSSFGFTDSEILVELTYATLGCTYTDMAINNTDTFVVTLKKGTVVETVSARATVKEDVVLYVKGEYISNVAPVSIGDVYLEESALVTDHGLSRFRVNFTTDVDTSADAKAPKLKVSVQKNDETPVDKFFQFYVEGTTMRMLLLPYSDLTGDSTITSATEIKDTYRITIKKGTVVSGMTIMSEDMTYVVADGFFYNEAIGLPDELTSSIKRDDKTTNVIAIEDLMEQASVINKTPGAVIRPDGNLAMEHMNNQQHPNFTIKSKENEGKFKGDYAVQFRLKTFLQDPATSETKFDPSYAVDQKVSSSLEFFYEFNASKTGNYYSGSDTYAIYFCWSKALTADDVDQEGNYKERYQAQFFCNGMGIDSPVQAIDLSNIVGFDKTMFDGEQIVTMEFGQFKRTINGTEYYVIYVEASNGDKSIYAECQYGGENIYPYANDGGYIRMATTSYQRTAPFEIYAVNPETTVTAKYAPTYTEASQVIDHDMSDYLPIGQEGVTYTTTSKEDKKNVINVEKFINNSKNDMYMSFKGDYNLVLAFLTDRYENKNCTAGYQVVFTPTEISVRSYQNDTVVDAKSAAYAMPENTKVKVTIRTVQLYIDGNLNGERVTVSINDEKIVEGDFDAQRLPMPSYFDGIMSGNGSVSIYPFDTTVVADCGLTVDVDETIGVGKKRQVKVEAEKSIIGATVSFRISEGAEFAELSQNEETGRWYIKGVKDGVIKVVAVVTNEFGTFEEEVSVTIGTGVATPDADNSAADGENVGCFGSIDMLGAPMMLVALCAVAVTVVRRKENN